MSQAQQLRALYNARQKASEDFQNGVREILPVGLEVKWKRGGNTQSGVITSQGYDGDCFVRNHRTLKAVKITAFDILAAAEDEASE
ncbi:hypothetical protein [Agrobacterium larrymoorei]|uniref:Uncharacterized protein n=1 Tax=Agrobacterium larrymoorei TaxID=160699 RepID=A0ABU0ULY6_9HYPH|nr:hypothetical protein [Agrobacterium larrymoorei]MDQ1185969.1 hypothetical protein [Agrobacterium larrymoorei]